MWRTAVEKVSGAFTGTAGANVWKRLFYLFIVLQNHLLAVPVPADAWLGWSGLWHATLISYVKTPSVHLFHVYKLLVSISCVFSSANEVSGWMFAMDLLAGYRDRVAVLSLWNVHYKFIKNIIFYALHFSSELLFYSWTGNSFSGTVLVLTLIVLRVFEMCLVHLKLIPSRYNKICHKLPILTWMITNLFLINIHVLADGCIDHTDTPWF